MNRSVYARALDLLAIRARSTSELRKKLLQKGAEAAEVEAAIVRLTEQRLLDDADFAQQFARSKASGARASRYRIVQELSRKGVARDVADLAVATLQQEEGIDLSASVHLVASKKWKTLAGLDEATRRRRLYAFLARRGFNPDEIKGAMSALGEQIDT